MATDTAHFAQLHSWQLAHLAHRHTAHADLIACDEELAYAIDADEYDTMKARDLRLGMVVRWDEFTDLTITAIEDTADGRLLVTFAGDLHPSTGLGEAGQALAAPGRPFQVYAG